MARLPAIALVASAVALAGCAAPPGETRETATSTLGLSFTGLEPLGAGSVYEGWLLVDGSPVSTGRFTVDSVGKPEPASFQVPAATARAARAFVLTVEPSAGDDPAPSAQKLLGGDFIGGRASLTTAHPAALGTAFAEAAGTYILKTPSTAALEADDDQGIWWVEPGPPMRASLQLPTLPAGWVWEGWVVGPEGPVSTGRFLRADQPDSDGAGLTAGPDPTPPFPGQDFNLPPVKLPGRMAVISVEPEPDDSPKPFAVKPLTDRIDAVRAGVPQEMQSAPQGLPKGTARLTA